MTPDATSFGMFMFHAGLLLGMVANIVIVIRGFRNGRPKE